MSLFSRLASVVGDTWATTRAVAVWPWPAVIVGVPRGEMLWTDYRAFCRKLLPGDFLLLRSKPFFGSNAAIPGAAKHLAVYIGAVEGVQNTEEHTVESVKPLGLDYAPKLHESRNVFPRVCVHAISEGVVCQDLGAVLMHADFALAVRPWGRRGEQETIVSTAVAQLGKPYDFNFNQRDQSAFFCTELGLHCCLRAAIIPPLSVKLRTRLFRARADVVIADYFAKFPSVCCSQSCLDRGFTRQSPLGAAFENAVLEAWAERVR
jgi:hypothetical protein